MFVMFPDGGNLQARILQLKGAVMRLVVEGFDDVVEFELVNGRWLAEDGRPVRFLFTPVCEQLNAPAVAAMQTSGVCSAGGSCLLSRVSAMQVGMPA
jgi:hypothetical protein